MPKSSARIIPRPTPLRPQRRAVLVGASSGVGAALARRLASQGYTVALLARRENLLKDLCNEINRQYDETRAVYYVHDVADFDCVPALLQRIVVDLGGLDVFIFMAGVSLPAGLKKYDFTKDRKMLEVNLLGALAWLNPVASMFQNLKCGQIVGISSVAGDRGRVGNPAYNASKAGLTCYLEALRNRLTRYGVNVLTIKPGFVKTALLGDGKMTFFVSTAEQVADGIWKAMRRRRQEVYVPGFWRWLMLVVRNIPSIIFRRLIF